VSVKPYAARGGAVVLQCHGCIPRASFLARFDSNAPDAIVVAIRVHTDEAQIRYVLVIVRGISNQPGTYVDNLPRAAA
jgi:hypothetical protein